MNTLLVVDFKVDAWPKSGCPGGSGNLHKSFRFEDLFRKKYTQNNASINAYNNMVKCTDEHNQYTLQIAYYSR